MTVAAATLAIPKEVLAFYYPWYGNPAQDSTWSHWDPDTAGTAATNITGQPSDGLYSSHDPVEVAKQVAEAKEAGLTGLISSWWGPGDFTDQSMPVLLAAAEKAGLSVTAYVDTGAITGTTEAELVASATTDLEYLVDHYSNSPAWLTVDGKPVVFIYSGAANKLSAADWKIVLAAVDAATPDGIVTIGPSGSKWAGVFGGSHDYSVAAPLQGLSIAQAATWATSHDATAVQAEQAAGGITTATVIPGFDNSNDSGEPLLVDDRASGQLYAAQWQAAIAANPDWVLVSTFNEWHEGSEIEPSTQYGSSYLTETAQYAAQFMPAASTASVSDSTASVTSAAATAQSGEFVATTAGQATVFRDISGGGDVITSLGTDTVYTGTGPVTVYAGGPSLVLYGGGGSLVFVGGMGNDQIEAGTGSATMWGGMGQDVLTGGSGGPNVLVSGLGNATLLGGCSDEMFGGSGSTIFAGSQTGGDIMVGGSGANVFEMTEGDVAFGGAGSNTFDTGHVGATPTVVVTGSGTNQVVFGLGEAIVFGALGSTTYTVSPTAQAGLDVISGLKEGDRIELAGYSPAALGQVVAGAETGAWGMTLSLDDGGQIVLLSTSHIDLSQLQG